jgi:3-phosphoshikimate 1-carboxyvinyltransferase
MQQIILPVNNPIDAIITIPGSKALTYRAMLLAALADGVSELSGIAIDNDTRALTNALHNLGIVVQLDEQDASCIIAGGNGRFLKNQANVSCANSNIVAQLLIPICAAFSGAYSFSAEASVQQLTLTPLLRSCISQGCQIIPGDSTQIPFTLIGADKIRDGQVIIDDSINITSVCAMLIAAIFARSPVSYILPPFSDPTLIKMTTAMMAEFGVLTHGMQQQEITIPAPQFYRAHDYTIEPDYSIAGYFFAAAAITGGSVSIKSPNHTTSYQPSVKFFNLLEKMGCKLNATSTDISLKGPDKLKGIDVSLRKFSAVFAALAVVAVFADSPTRITHAGYIQSDEITLLATVSNTLTEMGISVEFGADWILIHPGKPIPITVKTHNDPRIAMAFSLIGLKTEGIVIEGVECLDTVFPAFFTHINQLNDKSSIKA